MRLGQDCETFLVDASGKHISAIGLINADKWHPMQIPGMPSGFTLQEDNVALEYGMPPAASEDEWNASIVAVMEKSREYTKGLDFSKLSCTVFDKDQMMHPAAHRFGCEPDYNAWTGEANGKPVPPHPFMRSAGGHIHIETKENPFIVAQAFDLFAVVPSVLMDEGTERRKLYGSAGACRIKPYGVECRALSNFWMFEEKHRRWAWRAVERALDNLNVAEEYQTVILEAINGGDKDAAEYLVNHLKLETV